MSFDHGTILMSSFAVFVDLVVGLFFRGFVVILCIQMYILLSPLATR